MDSFVLNKEKDEILLAEEIRSAYKSVLLKEILEQNPETDITSKGFMEQINARANVMALERAIEMDNTKLIARCIRFQLADAEKNGWHHTMEYDTVEEMVLDRASEFTSPFVIYDLKGITQVVIPLAREAEVPEPLIWHITTKENETMSKLRTAIPTFREISRLRDKKDRTNNTKRLINLIANPNVSVRELRGQLNADIPQPYEVREFYLTQDKSYIMVKIDNEIQRRAVRKALKKLPETEISITDVASVLNELTGLKRR